ncbi:MAG: PASTA domain-containing protein [Firmicutes bacterium]|nr:PASTA domain-containing protein [Bacillota bacterium]
MGAMDNLGGRRRVRRRIVFLVSAFALALALLVGRLGELALWAGPGLRAYAVSERTRTVALPALRGEILDAEGHVLAGNIVVDDVSVAPRYLTATDVRALARALGVTPAAVRARMRLGSPLYAMVAQGVSSAVGDRVSALNLPDVVVTPRGTRTYPNGDLLGPVLGFVGVDGQGLAGLEYEDNRLLAGVPGEVTEQVDAGGNPIPSLTHVDRPPRPGDTLRLTIDRTLTLFAQQVLDAGVRKAHATDGRILVMDPATGAILAMAQYPSGNPNDPGVGPTRAWDDSIVQNVYPPGSTFKPVTAAGALRDGVITPQTTWYDPGYKVIDGVLLHGWEYPRAFGRVTLTRAFEVSSDIAFIDIGLAMGTRRFYQNLRLFGLMQPPPVDLPGAAAPLVLPERLVRPIDLADEAFGQTNAMSALQLAMVDSAVANGGLLVRPHVVAAVYGPDGRPVRTYGTDVIRRVMPPWVAAVITRGMEAVISPQGTGAAAAVPGYVLAGKTGTAQLAVGGRVGNTYMSSFIGFGPLPNPRVLILVQLNRPKGAFYGGQIAAPLFGQLMGETLRYLGIPPTQPLPRRGVRTVPRVVGLTPAAAARAVTGAGLVPLPLGAGPDVVATEPGAGTQVVRGGTVTLLLGRPGGRAPGGVPDVVGLPLRKAAILLAQRGLRLLPAGSGLAVSQTPAAGSPAVPGAAVRVVFRLPSAPPPPPPRVVPGRAAGGARRGGGA